MVVLWMSCVVTLLAVGLQVLLIGQVSVNGDESLHEEGPADPFFPLIPNS
jgi:hypothetical protein